MSKNSNQPVPSAIGALLKICHEDIDRRYASRNRAVTHYGSKRITRREPITPYSSGTVIRLKTLSNLVAQAHPCEFYHASTGLDYFDDIQSNSGDNFAGQNDLGNNGSSSEYQDGEKNRNSRGNKPRDIDLACFLIESFLELEPREFKTKIGLSDLSITDEGKILKQTIFLLNFYDYLYAHLYTELPYSAGKDYEQLIIDVTKYNWEATANIAFQQYSDLRRVWIEIKVKIFDFKNHQLISHSNAKAVNSDSDTDCKFNKYKGMADSSLLTECTLDTISILSPAQLDLSLCLNPENNRISVTNHSRSVVSKFIELIETIPIDKFSTCEYEACRRCIIITDKRKRCCNKKIRACNAAWSRIKKRRGAA